MKSVILHLGAIYGNIVVEACGGLKENDSHRLTGSGTIRSQGFVGVGVALSETVSHWGWGLKCQVLKPDLLGNIWSHCEPRVFICIKLIKLTLGQEAMLATS